jgi:hypothetical protein
VAFLSKFFVYSKTAMDATETKTAMEAIETKTAMDATEMTSEQPLKSKKTARFYLSIFWLCLVSVVASMDSVIVAAVLPKIAEDLQASTVQVFWCGTGFLLAQTVSSFLYCSSKSSFNFYYHKNNYGLYIA